MYSQCIHLMYYIGIQYIRIYFGIGHMIYTDTNIILYVFLLGECTHVQVPLN